MGSVCMIGLLVSALVLPRTYFGIALHEFAS